MTDFPTREALEDALSAAVTAHEDYESVVLRGMVDDRWPGFCAAYVIGRFGDFVPAGRLATLLEEVDAEGDWATAAADHVMTKLRS